MRILGVDPGLRICGYACLESKPGKEELVEAGVLRTVDGLTLEARLDQIAHDISTVLRRLRPEVVAVEELYSHYVHPKTAILMGHARGVILQQAAATGIEVRSFGATRIKKSITGNGRASKGQLQRTIQTVLSLAELPKPSDVADAIAAALCCANSMGVALVGASGTKR